jgi:hypothetical protein
MSAGSRQPARGASEATIKSVESTGRESRVILPYGCCSARHGGDQLERQIRDIALEQAHILRRWRRRSALRAHHVFGERASSCYEL